MIQQRGSGWWCTAPLAFAANTVTATPNDPAASEPAAQTLQGSHKGSDGGTHGGSVGTTGADRGPGAATVGGLAEDPADLSITDLLERLRQDRLWLLRQIDGGRWSEWRLDLAALERELGQLLDQAADHTLDPG